jgi:hypothetical protein
MGAMVRWAIPEARLTAGDIAATDFRPFLLG